MNKILFWLLSLLLLQFSASLRAQKQGIEIDEPPTPPFLLGDITQSDLKQGSYASWFQPAYQAYSPSPTATAKLEKAFSRQRLPPFFGNLVRGQQTRGAQNAKTSKTKWSRLGPNPHHRSGQKTWQIQNQSRKTGKRVQHQKSPDPRCTQTGAGDQSHC